MPQEDNGLPVHIKGGTTDVLLYRLTMTITITGKQTVDFGIFRQIEHHFITLFPDRMFSE